MTATSFLRDALQPAALPFRQLGMRMAISLAVLELVAASFTWLRGQTPRFDITGYDLVKRFAWWSLVFTSIFLTSNHPSQYLIAGAEEIANAVTGLDGFNPTNTIAQGHFLFIEYSTQLYDVGVIGNFLTGNFTPLLLTTLAGLAILISYYVVALAVYVLIFQATFALALHPIFWAFGAARWTAPLFDGYATFLFRLAFKTLLLALMIKAGDGITFWLGQIVTTIDNHTYLDSAAPMQAVGVALAYALGAMLTGPIAAQITGRFGLASTLLRQQETT